MSQNSKGIFYMLSAMWIFTTLNAMVKGIVGNYPMVEILFFRHAFALLPILYLVQKAGGPKTLKVKTLPTYGLLAVTGFFSFIGLFMSLKLLPLSNAITLHFSETLFVTIFAALFLKEAVGLHRWTAVAVGFSGVIVMMRPTSDLINIGAFYALAWAVGDAFYMVMARLLTRTQESSTVVFYYAGSIGLIAGLILPFFWVTPTLFDTIQLIALGIGGGIGHYFVTQAYKHADASLVSPMIFTALLWSVLYGYLFWRETPDQILYIGAGLILISGFYIIYRETRKAA